VQRYTYGITRGGNKCAWVEKELGVENTFDYKSPTFQKYMAIIGSVDVYFDNVRGELVLKSHPPVICTVSAR